MNDKLLEWLASVSKDPYAFVLGAFPWHEAGTRLEKETGPEPWQIDILCAVRDGLIDLTTAIQIAVASGHGVGKSCLVAWLILWGISTLPDTRGVVTANTESQLKGKTWAELGKWYHMFIAKEHFTLTATSIHSADSAHERTWRIDMVPWSERNTEAFAGLHNKGRRIIVIFDEASAIPDIIWETTEGALTDAETEIIWAVFGNPTRNSGRFREAWARFAKFWTRKQVDSRTVSFTNKLQIAKWIDAYGDDSDFVRIRVKGEFPKVGEMEFFSAEDIDAAMLREVGVHITMPLALGVDVARFGANNSVLYFRKGRDGRSLPRQVYNGLSTVSLSQKVSEAFTQYRPDGIFIDGGGVGGGVVDIVRSNHLHCYDIQFGSKSDNPGWATGNEGERYANKRAEMYGAARAWLKTGSIPNDPELAAQLKAITYTFNRKDEIILTSKEDMMRDGLPSPDDVDAFVLTFAYPLHAHDRAGGDHPQVPLVESEYNPYDEERMVA